MSSSKLFFAVLITVLVPVAAYAKSMPATDNSANILYEDAHVRGAAGDIPGAIIQLKNALQQDPNHLPARITLGKYLMSQGDASGAEKEMRLALSFGGTSAEIFPTLGNALLVQLKYQEILDIIGVRGASSDSGFVELIFRGRAYYELGQLKEAEQTLERAQALAPERPQPYVHLAEVQLARGRVDEAFVLLDKAISVAPNDTRAWHLRGEALGAAKDLDGALAAYDRVLKRTPKVLSTRLARAGLYLKLDRPTSARADAEFVLEANPDDTQASFLLWQAALRIGDDVLAKEAAEAVSSRLRATEDVVLMKSALLLRIAALLSYRQGDLELADRYLGRFLQLSPNDMSMQRVHGQVKLQLGEAQDAIRILHPLYRQNSTDLDVLLGLGKAYIAIGHHSEASGVLEKASKLAPHHPTLEAYLALSRAGLGDWEQAVTGLDEAVAADASGKPTSLMLSLIQLRSGESDAALATLESYIERSPADPMAFNLLGLVQASRGDLPATRAAFEAAVETAPDYLTAQFNLAKLDFAEGEAVAATTRLEKVVEQKPDAGPALMLLADIALAQNDMETAVRWLEKAASGTVDVIPALAKVAEVNLTMGRPTVAFAIAERLTQMNPEDALAIETLANAQAAMGSEDKALRNYHTAAHYAGYDGAPLMRIARRQVELSDYSGARKTLIKAASSPASIDAAAALTRLDIHEKQYDAAAERIWNLKGQTSTEALSHILNGELLMAQDQLTKAIDEFEAGHKAQPNTESILALFDALDAGGRRQEAIERLEQWISENRRDLEAHRKLALWYLPMRKLDKAKPLLERLIVLQPTDPVLLSSLARLYQLEGDSRARGLAERAVASKPDWPVALDTLGWILVTENETTRGLKFLREAIAREDNPLTRYHLAQALNELGRGREARVELRRILNSGRRIEWMADVKSLYDSIASAQQP